MGDIEDLIEASSLGTPAAKALRESVSEEEAQRIVDRVNQMRDERCGIEDYEDEDGPHRCDRPAGHPGKHSCDCAYDWAELT